MNVAEEAGDLLAAAAVDLDALTRMVADPDFPRRWVGQAAQQCLEKCLKVWLLCVGEEYPFSHDLSGLVNRLDGVGADVETWSHLGRLTPYAGWVQYANPRRSPDDLDAGAALSDAQRLYRHVAALVAALPDEL